MPKDIYADCVNGELRPGDLVISTPDDEYACLVGTVLEINKLGTPEHDAETENTTDDVHVNFYNDYSDSRIAEIEAMFSDLYNEPKEYEDCPIDDTIMAPGSLIRITGIENEKLDELLESYDSAAAFCHAVVRTLELTGRLTRNLTDYRDSLLLLDKEEIIGQAGEISAMSDAHYYLTENYDFEPSEVEYLLLFENPLEVVADKWYERVGQLDDFTFALDAVFGKKDALEGGYVLYTKPEPPMPLTETPADIKQAARHEAERLLYELKRLDRPNCPDKAEYMTPISPEFIRQASFSYDKLLFEAFSPPMPMTFGGDGKGGTYLSMTGGVRAAINVVKPSIEEQLREAREKAAEHNARNSQNQQKKREGEVL